MKNFMFKFSNQQTDLRDLITKNYREDEKKSVDYLLNNISISQKEKDDISKLAKELVIKIRENKIKSIGVDALMHEFSLSSDEGIALMCLAESLLRVPDKETQNKLIKDKISAGDWRSHLNKSPSLFVNAAAWGLLITGKLTAPPSDKNLSSALSRMISKGGEPLIRKGIDYSMRLLGKQFVTGKTIEEALKNGKEKEKLGYRFSFDMLGEAAFTQKDADKYFNDYITAIHAIGKDSQGQGIYQGNGISVKLSAIHPRYSRNQYKRVVEELYPRLKELFLLAQKYNIGLNIDAEEANRLELSLDLMEKIAFEKDLANFNGIGFVVQAYQKRSSFVIDYLIDLAKRSNHRFMIRLVKGAYWDSEIKWAQMDGLKNYPVYTRKVHTDISYLVNAKKLLAEQKYIFPQFASHNAYTIAAIYNFAKDKEYEFQGLHGMSESIYNNVVGSQNLNKTVRIYAPVGTHETLLAYLVRRLLENGANTSFVNQLVDKNIELDSLIVSPLDLVKETQGNMHSKLNLPEDIYGEFRKNSLGLDLSDENSLKKLEEELNHYAQEKYHAKSLLDRKFNSEEAHKVQSPANKEDIVGKVEFIKPEEVSKAIDLAILAQNKWANTPVKKRADSLRRFALILEQKYAEFIMLCIREAGKSIANSISEIREAIDFCRYYANQAETELSIDSNPVGTIVAISPWNFPLAIFIGEVVSSLVSGNTVLAKPAEQTNIIAYKAVQYLHQAGIPKDVLQLLLGAGDIGALLTEDPRINGVLFTGSTQTAKIINKNLAKRDDNPILIAETGGQNTMIVDSTALPEQVIYDVIMSAFDSAGQRCSALRVLCLQEEIADKFLVMLKGAMQELKLGDPRSLDTDIGPVIDKDAQKNLLKHIKEMSTIAHTITSLEVSNIDGTYIAPTIFELDDLSILKKEVFGPILHIVRYKSDKIDELIESINKMGYALTHGIHSRINSTVDYIVSKIESGNIYINRNIIGAVVGVQPFGGHNLSGTGPKAGGPFYLQKLTTKKSWLLPKLTQEGIFNNNILDQLEQKIGKLGLKDKELKEVSDAIGRSRINSLTGAYSELQGPTGETNKLFWKIPPKVWLYGGTLSKALGAFFELVIAGSLVYITKESPLVNYKDIFNNYIFMLENPWQEKDINLCIALSKLEKNLKLEIAKIKGPIVKIINAVDNFDILQVYQEISISINTTAAGGNANLMTMSDK